MIKKHRLNKLLFVLSVVLIVFTISCSSTGSQPEEKITAKNTNPNVALGVPIDADSSDDYLIFRPQYVLSYNKNRNTANWISWELNSKWYGDADRYSGNFIVDKNLPDLFYHVKHSDYTNSGYDRGHMVRSEERTDNSEDNKSTFLLTNILPQKPDLNQGVWLNLEYYCEDLCKKENKELYIIAGGVFHSGIKIKDLVSVPDSCFKIIVALEKNQDYKNIDADTPVIAVMMPNAQGIRKDKWEKYITTVKKIEHSTGYDFLNNLPQNIQDIIENKL